MDPFERPPAHWVATGEQPRQQRPEQAGLQYAPWTAPSAPRFWPRADGARAHEALPAHLWARADVLRWLESVGLRTLRHAFARARVDGRELLGSSPIELYARLGVGMPPPEGPRLERALAQLRARWAHLSVRSGADVLALPRERTCDDERSTSASRSLAYARSSAGAQRALVSPRVPREEPRGTDAAAWWRGPPLHIDSSFEHVQAEHGAANAVAVAAALAISRAREGARAARTLWAPPHAQQRGLGARSPHDGGRLPLRESAAYFFLEGALEMIATSALAAALHTWSQHATNLTRARLARHAAWRQTAPAEMAWVPPRGARPFPPRAGWRDDVGDGYAGSTWDGGYAHGGYAREPFIGRRDESWQGSVQLDANTYNKYAPSRFDRYGGYGGGYASDGYARGEWHARGRRSLFARERGTRGRSADPPRRPSRGSRDGFRLDVLDAPRVRWAERAARAENGDCSSDERHGGRRSIRNRDTSESSDDGGDGIGGLGARDGGATVGSITLRLKAVRGVGLLKAGAAYARILLSQRRSRARGHDRDDGRWGEDERRTRLTHRMERFSELPDESGSDEGWSDGEHGERFGDERVGSGGGGGRPRRSSRVDERALTLMVPGDASVAVPAALARKGHLVIRVRLWAPGRREVRAGALRLPIADLRDAKRLDGSWALSGGSVDARGAEVEMAVVWAAAGRESAAEALLAGEGRLRRGGGGGGGGGVSAISAAVAGLPGVGGGAGVMPSLDWQLGDSARGADFRTHRPAALALDAAGAAMADGLFEENPLWAIAELCKQTRQQRAGRKAEPELRAISVARARRVGTLHVGLVEASDLAAKDNVAMFGQTKSDPFVEFYVGARHSASAAAQTSALPLLASARPFAPLFAPASPRSRAAHARADGRKAHVAPCPFSRAVSRVLALLRARARR